jgi:hypothetical protein
MSWDAPDQEVTELLERELSNPNPFDFYSINSDPIEAWLYVLHRMPNVTRCERHFLLRTIVAVRRFQKGKIDEGRTNEVLADVIAGKYDMPKG